MRRISAVALSVIVAGCASEITGTAELSSSAAASQLWLLTNGLERAAPFTKKSVESAIGVDLLNYYSDSEGISYSTDGDMLKGDLWADSLHFRVSQDGEQKRTRVAILFIRDRSNPGRCIPETELDRHFGVKPDWMVDDSKGHAFPGIWKYYKRSWGEIVVAIPSSALGVSSQCIGDIYFDSPGLLGECWKEDKCRKPYVTEEYPFP